MSYIGTLISSAILALSAMSHNALASNNDKTYAIDATHSSVNFSVNHMGYTDMIGRFNKMQGNVGVNQSGKAQISIEIESASVDTNHEKRDAHLRSPDFFNAKQFPVITLESEFDLNKNANVIEGEVSMLGKTRTVEFALNKGKQGKDPWGLNRIGYSAKTTIKRSDFGMNFMQGGIGDDITVKVYIEAVQQ